MKKALKIIWIIVAIMVAIIILLIAIGNSDVGNSKEETSQTTTENINETYMKYARYVVKENLKSPDSATFLYDEDDYVITTKNNIITVSSKVTAKNEFNVDLTQVFICKFKYQKEKDQFIGKYLKLGDQVIYDYLSK